jgi:membrane associated rhomboid family serine protease
MLLTGAYVHGSTQHLLGNLVGLGIGAGIAYKLCDVQNRRQWFWETTAVFLLVLPVLVNLTDYAVFQMLELVLTSRGFSGVVAGYVGFVLVALASWLIDRHDRELGAYVGVAIFLVLMGEILVIYSGTPSLIALGLLGVGIVLTLGSVLWRGVHRSRTDEERRVLIAETAFVIGVMLLLAVFVWVMFPEDIMQDETVTNIIAHFAGFGWGMILALVTRRVEPLFGTERV